MVFPILIYHDIFGGHDQNKEAHAIHLDEFQRQLEYLYDNGFMSMNLINLLDSKQYSNWRNQKIIALSFDDGHYSDFSIVFPLLKEFNFVGNFFITVDWVGKEGHVSWENLLQMNHEGMAIHSHSMTHRFLSNLTMCELRVELSETKKRIEQQLNKQVDFVSLPGGYGSKKVTHTVEKENYKGLCTSIPGLNEVKQKSFFVLYRINITRRTEFKTFKRIVNGDSKVIQSMKKIYLRKLLLRRVIGNKLYYQLWRIFRKQV